MNEEVIRIEDILYALKKRWRLIAIITLAATLLSGIMSFFIIKPEYEARVKLFIGKEGTEGTSSSYSSSDVSMYQNLMQTYAAIIQTKDLIEDALDNVGIDKMSGSLSVSPQDKTQILQIKYTSTNKNEIVDVLNAVTEEFMDKSKDLIPNGNVQVIEEARMPKSPISPNKTMNIAIAFLLGLMVSVGLVFLLEYLDNTFKTKEELESYLELPVLGTIPVNNEE